MLIVDMPMPSNCLWMESGQIKKCPMLRDDDSCALQDEEASESYESWVDQMKHCPLRELVRCGECRKAELFIGNCRGFCHCNLSGMTMKNDDFCSFGERKDGNG